MDDADLEIRNLTYRRFADQGTAPTLAQVAADAERSIAEVRAAWSRLHDAHALVLNGARDALRMANPFSAAPTAYRVRAAGRWWYANCAWDAFGVCAALRADGAIECSCPDCGEPIGFEVQDGEPSDRTLLFHCLVPAERWWDDIAFT